MDKTAHGLAVGMRAHVVGNTGTNGDGEKYIAADVAASSGAGS
ncbi:MAG: hypothetical protein H6Q40_646, partial [Deltaproteobacteria bacterium]|nr:hypothetical protein [Deltaproteobacteria bacterium]